jgi:hypothetical protein
LLESNELQQHVLRSYYIMRVGIAVIGFALPFLLLFGGLAAGICAKDSNGRYC